VNDAQCSGCGTCAGFCQFGAISVQDSRAIVNSSLCMGCGVCASKCTQEAISLVRAPDRGEPLEIQELMERAI
jgi:MinD superfamily P-loop ATPase